MEQGEAGKARDPVTCQVCEEFDRAIAIVERLQRREAVSDDELAELKALLIDAKDEHVDSAGEASWEG